MYLHGFASSAQSGKAAYFSQRIAPAGVAFECPDLNDPDFQTLTMTRMIDRVGERLSRVDGRVALIGSSLGGTLAILAADRFADRVDRVLLLAPAVMFTRPGHNFLPPERIAQWRREGALPFFHHGYGETRLLDVGFYEDSLQYDPFAAVLEQPVLIFQGRHDASVDYRSVEQFAHPRPNVTLSLVDDDHQLIASLPRIWDATAPFLGLA